MTSTTHADASTPSLPTGTVTFLFTDIEGSTRLWESQQAAMQAALPRHDALRAPVHRAPWRPCVQDRRRCVLRGVPHRARCAGGGTRGATRAPRRALAGIGEAPRAHGAAYRRGRIPRRRLLRRPAQSRRPPAGGRPWRPDAAVRVDARSVPRSPAAAGHRQGAGRARAQGPGAARSGVPALPSRSAAELSAAEDNARPARPRNAVDRRAAVHQHVARRGERVLRRRPFARNCSTCWRRSAACASHRARRRSSSRARTSTFRRSRKSSTSPPSSKAACASPASACASPRS